ncbi:hypothetical protein [Bradyrhizobium sp. USDA 4350]
MPFNVEVMPRLQTAIDAMPASNHLTFFVAAQGNSSPLRALEAISAISAVRRGCPSAARRTVSGTQGLE